MAKKFKGLSEAKQARQALEAELASVRQEHGCPGYRSWRLRGTPLLPKPRQAFISGTKDTWKQVSHHSPGESTVCSALSCLADLKAGCHRVFHIQATDVYSKGLESSMGLQTEKMGKGMAVSWLQRWLSSQ